jgi:Lipid A core - O-antigen ligase and related enzymes
MRAAIALCLGLILAALLATGSRAGLVSAGVGLVVLLGLSGAVPRGRLALVLAAGVGGLSYAYGGGVAARWLELFAAPPDRIILWQQVLGMLADRPLAGVGLDSFAPAFRSYHGPGLPVTVIWDHAHNSYLETWAELGLIVGSLPVLAAMLAARRLAAAQPDPRADMRRAIALAVLVQAGLHAGVDFSFEIAANVLILLLIVMGGAAVPHSAAALVAGKGRRG